MSVSAQVFADSEGEVKERRRFPRILASCPVQYSQPNGGAIGEAELCDYSATGVRMLSDTTLLQSSEIRLLLMPDAKSRVPRISAEATVLRCGLREDHRYEIACKLTKVKRHKM